MANQVIDVVVTSAEKVSTPGQEIQYTSVVEDSPPSSRKSKTTIVAIFGALLVVGATVAALVSYQHNTQTTPVSVRGIGDLGVCYDSYEAWIPGKIEYHFQRIKERFSTVRTFQTIGLRNHIDVAAEVGLEIYAGVWIQGGDVGADMRAAVDGAQRHPDIVKAIIVGNEELLGGKFSQNFVLEKVREMKNMLDEAGIGHIKVGCVQTDGDWFGAGDLAQECAIMGVNIHPFFSGASDSASDPIQDLQRRWQALYERYGKKLFLAETGWPTSGNANGIHVPSMELATKYANDVIAWVRQGNGGHSPAYFMFHDNPGKTPDFEKAFGLAWSNGYWKFDIKDSGASPQPPADDIHGVVFVNTVHDYVLAVKKNREVEFHKRWGADWVYDYPSQWTIRGALVVSWDAEAQEDLCLDAYEAKNGGKVHVFPCDPKNPNQQWQYDAARPTLRHATHQGYCLDMKLATGGKPHLYSCLDVPLQKIQWWQL